MIKKIPAIVFIFLLFLILTLNFEKIFGDSKSLDENLVNNFSRESLVVGEVMDPITFKDDKGLIFRFIGIEPLKKDECYYEEALDYMNSLIGKKIEIEIEPLLIKSKDEALTIYGFLNDNDNGNDSYKLMNEKILELGLAFPHLNLDMIYGDKMLAAANYARATKKGLWINCNVKNDNDKGLRADNF